jgi:hypothetical protein
MHPRESKDSRAKSVQDRRNGVPTRKHAAVDRDDTNNISEVLPK